MLGQSFDLAGKRVFVAGHRGMVGAAVVRRLQSENCTILTAGRDDMDLLRQADVEAWMAREKPDAVIIAAAKVGGIHANSTFPAQFIYENLMIECNLIHASYEVGVEKLLFLGSSCIYPRLAEQPIREDSLLTGPLEPTNEWYAIAKIAGIKLCQAYRQQHGCDFISAMPTNLFGEGDNFHPTNSHVPAALLQRFHDAREANTPEVVVWGTGTPKREFLFVDDMADACIFLLKHYSGYFSGDYFAADDCRVYKAAIYLQKASTRDGLTVKPGSHRTKEHVGEGHQVKNDVGDVVFFDVRISHTGQLPDLVETGIKAAGKIATRGSRLAQEPNWVFKAKEAYWKMMGRRDRLSVFFTYGAQNRFTEEFAAANMSRQTKQAGAEHRAYPPDLIEHLNRSGVPAVPLA